MTSRSNADAAEKVNGTHTQDQEIYEELSSGRVMRIPEGYLTLAMIQERTGLTKTELKSFIHRGLLKGSERNNQGWYLFKVEDVEKVVRLKIKADQRSTGKVRPTKLTPATADAKMVYSVDEGISVFTMLDKGAQINQIFLKTRIHPAVICTIIKDYELMTKSFMIPKAMIDEMNKLSLEGNFPLSSAADVLNVMKLAAETRRCPDCEGKRSHALRCEHCIRRSVIKSMERDAKLRKLLPAEDPNLTSLDETDEDAICEAGANRDAGTRTEDESSG